MRRSKLDKIDKKILLELQQNGRVTNVDLAKQVGISAPPCLRRVRALEEAGYIKSYHATIDASVLGYGVTVYAMVKLDGQSDTALAEFESYIKNEPMVRECHLLAGDVDFMLRVVAKNWDDYQEFHTNKLTNAPHVSSVKSTLTIRSSKEEPGVPIEQG